MKSFNRFAVAYVVLMLAAGTTLSASAEPMPTLLGFDRGTYDDSGSRQIVVRITRVDQEPNTGVNEQFSVECTINGGTAVRGVDYRLGLDGGVLLPTHREASDQLRARCGKRAGVRGPAATARRGL